jgi:hypothetical protein
MSYRIDDDLERWKILTAARIVEEIAVEERRP